MVAAKEKAREGFAERLVESLVDLGIREFAAQKRWLAQRHAISGEAARKWLQGLAMPDQARWESLASSLEKRAEWLRDGVLPKQNKGLGSFEGSQPDGVQSQGVKLESLTLALSTVTTELAARHLVLPPRKFAEVVAIAYECIEDGMPEARLLRYVRTAIS